jgi:hypothetical protein
MRPPGLLSGLAAAHSDQAAGLVRSVVLFAEEVVGETEVDAAFTEEGGL